MSKALTARRIERLTSRKQGQIGWHRDAAVTGLHLQITRLATLDKPAAASWVLRFTVDKKVYYHGLGSLQTFNLDEARKRATKARQLIADGINPVETRKADKAARALEAAKTMTFERASEEYFEAHQSKWKSATHRQQFTSTLGTYVHPIIGKLAVADIDTGLVLKCLEPIWATKTETASRTRQRIEAVLDWCTVRGYRTGDNPARWRGHLAKVLPAPADINKVKHHPALPYAEVPAFLSELRRREGLAARALELTILCATRTSETLNAKWSEFNLDEGVWEIPAERMKASKAHTIPLSDQAVELLRMLPREGEVVFPGLRKNTPMSNMAMSAVLERMGRSDITTHGFRATFRTWAAERTSYQEHVIEQCLAHAIGTALIKAYQRGELLEKRAKLMQAWATFCATPAQQSSVIPIRR